MHDEHAGFGRVPVDQPAVPEEQLDHRLELPDRVVRAESGLFPLSSRDPDSDVGLLDHANVVSSVANPEHTLSGQFHGFCDLSLLGRGASAAAHR